ncbi:MAG TPA: pentapeptide repeat-containing protein [Streptosporangiaceae bacterium]|nr:pentapeptide repeat-containing protein [Streptosporangiaceae bacterium]
MSSTNENGGESSKKRRDWPQKIIALAAAVALLGTAGTLYLTYRAFNDSHEQLVLNEQAQVTGWYSAAVTDLGSPSVDARVGGIDLLQQVMRDAPSEQPVVINILTTFIQDHAALPDKPIQQQASLRGLPVHRPEADVQAALTVLATRNPVHDGGAVIDLNLTNLTGANLSAAHFSNVCLVGAILSGADLQSADLSGADLFKADVDGANLLQANLRNADLDSAMLLSANTFDDTSNPVKRTRTDLEGAGLWQANLTGADFAFANFADANLVKAILRDAYLKDAAFYSSYVRQAYFGGAVGRNLSGANRTRNEPQAKPIPCGIN